MKLSTILLLIWISMLSLACGMTVPATVTQTATAEPTQTATVAPTPTECIALQEAHITAVTALNIRSCASISCDEVTQVYGGAVLVGVCSNGWCYEPSLHGYFCLEAALGIGGCE